MNRRTYGRLWLEGGVWKLHCEPHVALWAKRVFQKIPAGAAGVFELTDSPAVCYDLQWFLQRFPLEVEHPDELEDRASRHVERIQRLDEIIDPNYRPVDFELALPPREYQRRAAELHLANGSLLLADDVGLGKTVTAICSLTEPGTLPAVVVCLAHLPRQWEAEVNRFAPDLRTHVIRKSKPYELPKFLGRGPDVLIVSYHKMRGWADVLAEYCNSVVFDECQELRRCESQKWQCAKHVANSCQYRCGLSATPIYNYGAEIFNVLSVVNPDQLGTRDEFLREWCIGFDRKARLKDPDAFGSWLREQHIMIRRTRRDVGRELCDLSRVTHAIESDPAALKDITDSAGELARIILNETAGQRGEKMRASEQFNNLLRQATGISKAPYVAAFVRMLIQNGEPLVLYGWHRACYEIWRSKLWDYDPAMYTGSESPAKKQREAQRFINGETPLLILSLRSGAGLDGLQNRCRTVVFGELDWSPGCHEQDIGRVYRDGQQDPVMAYFLLAEDGADPFIAEALGLKREQVEGIRSPGERDVVQRADTGDAVKRMAAKYLEGGLS